MPTTLSDSQNYYLNRHLVLTSRQPVECSRLCFWSVHTPILLYFANLSLQVLVSFAGLSPQFHQTTSSKNLRCFLVCLCTSTAASKVSDLHNRRIRHWPFLFIDSLRGEFDSAAVNFQGINHVLTKSLVAQVPQFSQMFRPKPLSLLPNAF